MGPEYSLSSSARSALILAGVLFACARSGLESFGEAGDSTSSGGGTGASGGGSKGCGDSVVEAGETCDDGNLAAGDGCSASCRAQPVLVAIGASFACALSSTGVVKCWGENGTGQLGLGDTGDRGDGPGEMGENLPPVELGSGRRATNLACGYQHCCALLDDGSLKCWGWNHDGQLGLGDTNPRGAGPAQMGDHLPPVDLGAGRKAVALAVAGRHSCAMLEDGSVKCWGQNFSGELGLGDANTHGSRPREMGDALGAVDLGSERRATGLVSGPSHTCAILDDWSVKCWGINSSGQLGLGDVVFRGDDAAEMGDALPAVDLGPRRRPTGMAAGISHTCAFFFPGALYCWGFNRAGQLGLGDDENRGDQAGEMGRELPQVDLGAGAVVEGVAPGFTHTCALLSGGIVKCWGGNDSGELGLGDRASRGAQPGEMGDRLPSVELGTTRWVKSVVTNELHSCALLDDGSLKCWGDNHSGRLGLGDTETRGDEPGEMGDALPALDLGF